MKLAEDQEEETDEKIKEENDALPNTSKNKLQDQSHSINKIPNKQPETKKNKEVFAEPPKSKRRFIK